MKKKNLKSLQLNKKAVSNLEARKGGNEWTWWNCETDNNVCHELSIPQTKCQDGMCFTYSCFPGGCTYLVC